MHKDMIAKIIPKNEIISKINNCGFNSFKLCLLVYT